MKIALAQLNFHTANFEKNIGKIISKIEEAKQIGINLIVFPELAICGYPPRDFLEFNFFLESCEAQLKEVAKHCDTIDCIIGAPSRNNSGKGKPLFNSAFFISKSKIVQRVDKSLLPNYDVFDEYRYFEPGENIDIIESCGIKIALTICEDLWNMDELPLYAESPMDRLIKHRPELMINIAASPFSYSQEERRNAVLKGNVEKYKIPLVYVNHVGAQTELIFDGNSKVLDVHGKIIYKAKDFAEDMLVYEFGEQGSEVINTQSKTEKIYKALICGIQDYFRKSGFSKAILGLSGGIDSAVVAALAAHALGKENVKGILLPSHYSSDHSVSDAADLAKNLGIAHEIIPIEKLYNSFRESLKDSFAGTTFGLAEENLQARVRGVLLMAQSNKFGYILLNTTNKSEAAVGYGTLYGDMCGGLSILGDVYKTEVYELANYINTLGKYIPINSIEKEPSAELRPDQKDSDSLPDYSILDKILYLYIEKRMGPNEIISEGFEADLVEKTLSLVNRNEYKRFQSPPILRISEKAFGMGRRMPIVAKY